MLNRGSFFKRRFYRIPFKNPIEFMILKYRHRNIAHLSAKRGSANGFDFGEDGLSFVSPYCLPEDMILRVVFDLPEFGEKRVLAKVVRSTSFDEGYLTAVQFLNMNGPRKEEFRKYITGETKKSYKFLKYL